MRCRTITCLMLFVSIGFFAYGAPPASQPTTRPEVDAAVARLIAEPGSKKYRDAINDPAIKADAWRLLVAQVRKPVPPQGGFIHLRMDNTDLLEAMAVIDGPRSVDLVLDLAGSS